MQPESASSQLNCNRSSAPLLHLCALGVLRDIHHVDGLCRSDDLLSLWLHPCCDKRCQIQPVSHRSGRQADTLRDRIYNESLWTNREHASNTGCQESCHVEGKDAMTVYMQR